MRSLTRSSNQDWTVVSIPGREEDGSDTTYFAFDRSASCDDKGRAIRCGSPKAAAKKARDLS